MMPKDFLQGASLKNSPHDVQTKGGGVKGLLNNVKKNCNVFRCRLPLWWHWWCLMASSGLLPAGCKSKDNVTPAISLQLPYSPTTHQARVLCDFRAIPCLIKYSFRHHLFLVLFRTNKAQITQGNCPNWDFFGMCSKISPPPYDYDDFGCLYTPG